MQKYDVALSFAGEDREHANELAKLLEAGGYSCFYDENELANLWGKNLYDYLSSVYKDRARYCVMFLSKHYEQKLWTNYERQNAQARAFKENKENREYILPVRLDDTEIPGIPPRYRSDSKGITLGVMPTLNHLLLNLMESVHYLSDRFLFDCLQKMVFL